MKKFSALILSALLATGTVFAVSAAPSLDVAENLSDIPSEEVTLADEHESKLLFYQDFDSLDTGIVTSKEIASMLGLEGKLVEFGDIVGIYERAGVDLPSGLTFEICEEKDGNKYLKVTGNNQYNAFGVYYPDSPGYTVMSYDYKHASADGSYSGLMRFAIGTNNTKSDACNWNKADLISANKTSWTMCGTQSNDSLVYGNGVGLGFVKTDATTNEIHIDDLAVWSFDVPREQFHDSTVQVAKTITFADSTGVKAAKLPTPVNGYAWGNLYGAQTGTKTLNLNNYTAAAAGYEFKGWSITDGGRKIKEPNYTTFKIIGDVTLYPIWEKAGVVSKFEDFESFEVGQSLSSSDLEFLNLNNFGASGFTATVILDEETGSKALCIESPSIYAGIQLKNRVGAGNIGNEYFQFDYRFKDDTPGSRFTIYGGSTHTGGNQRDSITTRSAKWSRYVYGPDPNYNVVGAFFDNGDSSGEGNFHIIIDDVKYWFVPSTFTAEDKAAAITFKNSTKGIFPTNVDLPELFAGEIWEKANTDKNVVNLNKLVPTGYSAKYEFAGWSRSDNGDLIKKCDLDAYRVTKGETFYAVWREATPANGGVAGINAEKNGIRFSSAITALQLDNADEFGYVAALKDTIGDSELTFALDDDTYVRAFSYKAGESEKHYVETEDGAVFNAVLTGVDVTNAAQVNAKIVLRSYMILDGATFYGKASVKSFADVAWEYKLDADAFDELSEEQQKFIDSIISLFEA